MMWLILAWTEHILNKNRYHYLVLVSLCLSMTVTLATCFFATPLIRALHHKCAKCCWIFRVQAIRIDSYRFFFLAWFPLTQCVRDNSSIFRMVSYIFPTMITIYIPFKSLFPHFLPSLLFKVRNPHRFNFCNYLKLVGREHAILAGIGETFSGTRGVLVYDFHHTAVRLPFPPTLQPSKFHQTNWIIILFKRVVGQWITVRNVPVTVQAVGEVCLRKSPE
jgi:hypothetical protein